MQYSFMILINRDYGTITYQKIRMLRENNDKTSKDEALKIIGKRNRKKNQGRQIADIMTTQVHFGTV